MDPLSRDRAVELDRTDPLGPFRQRFLRADEVIYLDGNSLGRLPLSTMARMREVVEGEWGRGLVRSWSDWVGLSAAIGDRIATGVLGAAAGEVAVADSTTVNLYKAVAAALEARPGRLVVVADGGDFPTDRYVLQGLCRSRRLELRLLGAHPIEGPQASEVTRASAGADVAVVVLSHVSYRSGALADMAAITEAAHRAGALTVWDLSHSAGAVPVELEASGADLAVGCTYKYLNGGPGAPAWLYVRRSLQESLRQPIWGWFGQREQFAMGPRYDPAPGIGSWLSGTPPVLGLVGVDEGLRAVLEAGIPALRAKSRLLTELAVTLWEAWLAPLGFALASPRGAERRGGHIAIAHPEAWRLCQALIDRFGVVPDFRAPDVLRLGPVPLYSTFVDVWEGLDRLRQAVASRAWEEYPAAVARVT